MGPSTNQVSVLENWARPCNTYVGIQRAGLDACGLQCNIELLFQENQ